MALAPWRVEHVESVDSTNTWLATQARAGTPDRLAVFADFQSAGRGRLERRWEAPAGSALMASVLVRDVAAEQAQLGVVAVALAIIAAASRFGEADLTLKWPNDVLWGSRKVAGLLAEYLTTPAPALIIGFGVNLLEPPQPERAGLASWGATPSARELLDVVLAEVDQRLSLVRTDRSVELLSEYRSRLATLGQLVRVELPSEVFEGVAHDIDEGGHLLVLCDGDVVTVRAGDVTHVRKVETS